MLQIRNLAFRYPQAPEPALNGISLSVRRGEVLGLLGPNGAGKTTLISHLSGSLPVQQGEILVDDEPLQLARERHPTRIAIAPQEYAFYPSLTVTENLECFAAAARLNGWLRRTRIDACLAFAQLERFAGTRAARLSGGLKRRLNLAIALLPSPQLVLFDEPTVGVDPQSRAFLLDAVKALARDGTAVIYTSHYMEEIEAIADQVIIMDHGQVLREGALHELLASGAARLRLKAEGLAPEQLDTVLAQFGDATCDGEYRVLALREGNTVSGAIAAIEQAGGILQQIDYGHYNLEHLFMSLTRRSLRDE